jgi:hypothetical protein
MWRLGSSRTKHAHQPQMSSFKENGAKGVKLLLCCDNDSMVTVLLRIGTLFILCILIRSQGIQFLVDEFDNCQYGLSVHWLVNDFASCPRHGISPNTTISCVGQSDKRTDDLLL